MTVPVCPYSEHDDHDDGRLDKEGSMYSLRQVARIVRQLAPALSEPCLNDHDPQYKEIRGVTVVCTDGRCHFRSAYAGGGSQVRRSDHEGPGGP